MVTVISANRRTSHLISQHVAAIALYSDYAVDIATNPCFLVRHEINEGPKKMQNPVNDRRVIGQACQSASQYARSCKEELLLKRTP